MLRSIWSAVFLLWSIPVCFGQAAPSSSLAAGISEGPALPPLEVAMNRLPARDSNAIAVDGWLLDPALRIYSLYSDNLFSSSQAPLTAAGVGITPSIVAEWTNGIHTTTLYGNLDREVYPTANDVNTIDGRAGFTQRYEALRDLTLTVNGDFGPSDLAGGATGVYSDRGRGGNDHRVAEWKCS
jgi:hypothetical protein